MRYGKRRSRFSRRSVSRGRTSRRRRRRSRNYFVARGGIRL